MIVLPRTFAAKLHPDDSPERRALNLDALTSEYMPSYRYIVRRDDGSRSVMGGCHRTKAEALAQAARMGHGDL